MRQCWALLVYFKIIIPYSPLLRIKIVFLVCTKTYVYMFWTKLLQLEQYILRLQETNYLKTSRSFRLHTLNMHRCAQKFLHRDWQKVVSLEISHLRSLTVEFEVIKDLILFLCNKMLQHIGYSQCYSIIIGSSTFY